MVILKSGVSNFVNLDGKIYNYFAGNNYLGLANNPEVIREAVAATEKYGINFSASRQTTGTSELHVQLERLLSDFNRKDDSAVFASGYMSNRIMLQALRNRYSAIFYDELSHPSILDSFPSDHLPLFKYQHSNPDHLENLLKENRGFRPLIITDGVFPLTGEIAQLGSIYQLAQKYEALTVVDDAHSAGLMGKSGRGTAEYFGLADSPDLYQSGTMSKAFGAYGGFISAEKPIIDLIRKNSSCYLASTSLPPAIVAAALAGIRIASNQPELRERLLRNSILLKEKIKEIGYQTFYDPTPIVPIFFNSEREALDLSAYLKNNNIIVPYVKYPVKMDKFIVRITASAIHTEDQIRNLLDVLNLWKEKHESNQD